MSDRKWIRLIGLFTFFIYKKEEFCTFFYKTFGFFRRNDYICQMKVKNSKRWRAQIPILDNESIRNISPSAKRYECKMFFYFVETKHEENVTLL